MPSPRFVLLPSPEVSNLLAVHWAIAGRPSRRQERQKGAQRSYARSLSSPGLPSAFPAREPWKKTKWGPPPFRTHRLIATWAKLPHLYLAGAPTGRTTPEHEAPKPDNTDDSNEVKPYRPSRFPSRS